MLITFDDGYRDNLENAVPSSSNMATQPSSSSRSRSSTTVAPSARGAAPAARGENATVDWDELAALEAGGIRIESHGIGHRPLSDLDPAEATREIAISKLRLEERLGREVEAYAFVKGSLADYRPEHASLVQQAGYKLAFTSVSGANGLGTDRFPAPPVQRRAISGEDARARALGGVRPDRGQGHGARLARPAGVQRHPRDRVTVSFETTRYTADRRAALVALLARVGTTQLSDAEFAWWFERNPAGRGSCPWPWTTARSWASPR